jgi:hypothetical protein
MSERSTLPVRVLVKGASTVVWTSWMGGPRTDLAYPRVVEAELRAAGQAADVRVEALPSARTKDALKTWEQEVVPWSPDVVVLHYGHVETIHLLLPAWLEHYANSFSRRPGKLRDPYYRSIVKKVWLGLATGQQLVDRRVDPTIMSNRPRQVAADLERLITRIRTVASPLVLVPDLLPPGPPWASWFPGMGRRTEVMNTTLDALVARLDQRDVRRFRITDVVAGLDLDGDPTPDGGHFSPTVHRAVGRALAQVILEWSAHQSHLQLPSVNGASVAPPVPRPLQVQR